MCRDYGVTGELLLELVDDLLWHYLLRSCPWLAISFPI